MLGMATSTGSDRDPYATDLTPAQFKLIEPLLPPANLAGRYEKHQIESQIVVSLTGRTLTRSRWWVCVREMATASSLKKSSTNFEE